MPRYIVAAVSERDDNGATLYWSNELGWASIEYATTFTESERDTLNLPLGGYWLQVT